MNSYGYAEKLQKDIFLIYPSRIKKKYSSTNINRYSFKKWRIHKIQIL